ncbi:MAG: double zinc ribbon domain-containing protein, partial [Aggregatilineales bacterium]
MDFETILPGLLAYSAVLLVVFWLALIIWAYRDMRARSRDPIAAIFVGISIVLLNVPGIFIYILLRPRETLAGAYERSLEEEALLQEIEDKPTCPGCSQRVDGKWQACPYCHTRLKKPCATCNYQMELSWDLCPNCA